VYSAQGSRYLTEFACEFYTQIPIVFVSGGCSLAYALGPPIRCLIGVGLVVTVLTVQFTTTDHLISLSLFPLYSVLTSSILAHRQQWLSLFRGDSNRSTRKEGRKEGAVIEAIVSEYPKWALFRRGADHLLYSSSDRRDLSERPSRIDFV